MDYKRILTVQDISCVGQCSITVALPILSACGFETCVLPCSILSNHTTGFDGYSYRDMAGEMPLIRQQWQRQNIKFSAIYSGYMGSIQQLENLKSILGNCLEDCGRVIVDPAMADGGVLYPGLDDAFVAKVKEIVPYAHWLLPNVTEACLLTDTPYRENYDEAFIRKLLEKLVLLGCSNVVITGVSYSEGYTGVATYADGIYGYYCHRKIEKSVPGTGDVFAYVFTGAILKGYAAKKAAGIAADFVVDCLEETVKHPNHSYGPVFEPVLKKLTEI